MIQAGKPLPEKYRFILFEDKREVELVWNGKTREVCTTVLPFQTLEHIDEPAPKTKTQGTQPDLFDSARPAAQGLDQQTHLGRQQAHSVQSSRAARFADQIEDAGGLKLIYIDPPFDVGADFSMDIEIGGETFHKEPNLLEANRLPRHMGARRRFLHRHDLRTPHPDARFVAQRWQHLCALRLAGDRINVAFALMKYLGADFSKRNHMETRTGVMATVETVRTLYTDTILFFTSQRYLTNSTPRC